MFTATRIDVGTGSGRLHVTRRRRNDNAVALVSLSTGQGGCQDHVMALARQLVGRGKEVRLLTSTEGNPQFFDAFRAATGRPADQIEQLNPGLAPGFLLSPQPEVTGALGTTLKEILPGTLHLHSMDECGQHVHEAIRALQEETGDLVPPIVQTIHDALGAELRAGPQDVGIFVSDYMRWLHSEQQGWKPDSKKVVVHPGTDLDLYSPQGARDLEIEGLPYPRIVVVARVDGWKGVEKAIRAFAALRAKHGPGWGSLVYCHPPLEAGNLPWRKLQQAQINEWVALAESLGIHDFKERTRTHVELAGTVGSADVVWSSSTYVQPATGPRHTEPFGLVGPQARAAGTPALVSDEGGPPEALPETLWDYSVVKLGSVEDLAAKTDVLTADRALLEWVAEEGMRHTREHLGLVSTTDQVLDAYELAHQVVAQRRG